MSDKLVSFSSAVHRVASGGMNMEIKHTHPEYETPQQREEALRDAKQACISLISALVNASRHSA